jgi:hypothetical protein
MGLPLTAPATTCPTCGEDLVLELDPAAPEDADAVVLSADPPYRYVCPSPDCQS